MGKRRRERELVLQALYESEFSDRPAVQVVEQQIERRGSSEEGAERARDLFLKTVEKRDELDVIISPPSFPYFCFPRSERCSWSSV